MSHHIQSLEPADLERLSRFLTDGFQTAPDADFAAPEVLRWKYLDPGGAAVCGCKPDQPRSYLALDEAGTIVGHVGICLTAFEGAAIPGGRTATLHMIDWLGSPGHPSVGASLMRKAHAAAPTQFGLGGSVAGRTVGKGGGYEPRRPVPVYQRVLRPAYCLRASGPGLGPLRKGARMARDLARNLLRPPRRPPVNIVLNRVSAFGSEIAHLVEEASKSAILTCRGPARLDHFLRFPRQTITGWHLLDHQGWLCGFALLNVVPQNGGRVRMGKIVDCLLGTQDAGHWHAALLALTRELERQGADVAQAFASTPWMAEGLRKCGYDKRFALEFSIRDRKGLIPRDATFHLTPIEADYAYT